MNHAATLAQAAILHTRSNVRGPALGWGTSLLVHALAIAWMWHASPQRPADTEARPLKQIEVQLVPIVAKVPPQTPAPSGAVPRSSPASTRMALRPTLAPHLQQASAAPTAPSATQTPALIATPAAPEFPTVAPGGTAADTPTFDIAAARAAARQMAREDRKGLVVLPGRKPVDPIAVHRFSDLLERARRIDCQTARADSINLLANVVMLAKDMVANAIDDSGCKW